MQSDEILRKTFQNVDSSRVRGRLQTNFGFMRSDDITRMEEMKKSLSRYFQENRPSQQTHKKTYKSSRRKTSDYCGDTFKIEITNQTLKRKHDPEVFIILPKKKIFNKRKSFQKRSTSPEVDVELEIQDQQQNDKEPEIKKSKPGIVDVLIV